MLVFLSFLRARVNEGHFRIKTIPFLLIELNSIRFGGNIRICVPSGNHVWRIIGVFSDRNNAASHATPG